MPYTTQTALIDVRLNFPYSAWGTAVQAEMDVVLVLGTSPEGEQLIALCDGVAIAMYKKAKEVTL